MLCVIGLLYTCIGYCSQYLLLLRMNPIFHGPWNAHSLFLTCLRIQLGPQFRSLKDTWSEMPKISPISIGGFARSCPQAWGRSLVQKRGWGLVLLHGIAECGNFSGVSRDHLCGLCGRSPSISLVPKFLFVGCTYSCYSGAARSLSRAHEAGPNNYLCLISRSISEHFCSIFERATQATQKFKI